MFQIFPPGKKLSSDASGKKVSPEVKKLPLKLGLAQLIYQSTKLFKTEVTRPHLEGAAGRNRTHDTTIRDHGALTRIFRISHFPTLAVGTSDEHVGGCSLSV